MTVVADTTIGRLIGVRRLFSGAVWTAGAFGVTQALRLATNIILARLFAPELFGIMQIVHSLRTGIELLTDVGIGQNIIYHRHANDPAFYNTAWTLQVIRGVLLAAVFCIIAFPVAHFYHSPILAPVILVASVGVIIAGFGSVSRFLMSKRMQFSTFALLDTGVALAAAIGSIALAYLMPNIWGLVLGSMVWIAVFAIVSHLVLPDVRPRLMISLVHAREILSFGKWIFASSLVYFLSMNFDRLYFAKTIPLEMLGIYGIARTLSELAGAVVLQLGSAVIFPFVAAHSQMPRPRLRTDLAPIRLGFILVAALGFSVFAAFSDLAIRLFYDDRYQAATWMLPVLLLGAWVTVLVNLNESTLLGLGRPSFSALSNASKFVFIMIGMLLSIPHYGVLGGVVVVAASDLCRYAAILVGQLRERMSFGRQDLLASAAVIALISMWEWLRELVGLGNSFEPIVRAVMG